MIFLEQYDEIASAYADSQKNRTTRKFAFDYTLFSVLGSVNGKHVLDLACGDGYFSRLIKQKGALEVFGIDSSKEMISLALNEEKKNPLGIKYLVGVVGDLGKIKEFDLVVAGFLLHYAKSVDELELMCKDIYTNLKIGGRFVALNNNPGQVLTTHKEYGSTVVPIESLSEGSKVEVTIWDGEKKLCSFEQYNWSKQAYESALKKVGFDKVVWHKLKVSNAGIKNFGEKFWENLQAHPHLVLIECFK